MMMMDESWAGLGSTIASLMFIWAMVRQYFPSQLDMYLGRFNRKLIGFVYPYVEITFSEYSGERLKRSEAYAAIESYLGTTCIERAKRLKAEMDRDRANLVISMDDHEEVTEIFHGVRVWWTSSKITSKNPSFSFYPLPEDRRYYRLSFHRSQRSLISTAYLPYVIKEGKDIGIRRRQRKLYTNNANYDMHEYRKMMWSHVPFEHPATFDTLAMEPEKKRDLIQDLIAFTKSKEYYLKIGKPWKRGYLLYGPPGTGKSTMIAAIANLLDYDVYDLELTAVKNNSALRKLLIETTSKSIIVIEDIDCSLDLSGKRKAKEEPAAAEGNKEEEEKKKMMRRDRDNEDSKVTLSGLLNFIDGLWSACGGERLIVFTTNYVKELDPALIRRGRMDKHIELSYCSFEAFKILAKNYLDIDSHPLFETIDELMKERNITPADVAENLMPKNTSIGVAENVMDCLQSLIQALKECKLKSEEEETSSERKEEKNEELSTNSEKIEHSFC